MKRDEIRESVLAAIESSAQPLTQILQQHVQVDGWTPAEARSLSVQVDGSSLTVKSESKKAADLEYGTDEIRPNPAVRRFANRKAAIDATILEKAAEQLRGVL